MYKSVQQDTTNPKILFELLRTLHSREKRLDLKKMLNKRVGSSLGR